MKRILLSITLALLVLTVMPGTALADPWHARNNPDLFGPVFTAAHQFEGRLTAYSNSGNPSVERQVLLASEELRAALEALNAAIKEVYPDMNEEDQHDVENAYASLNLYLHNLAAEANLIFQEKKEEESLQPRFTYTTMEEGDVPRLPGQMWVGSSSSGTWESSYI